MVSQFQLRSPGARLSSYNNRRRAKGGDLTIPPISESPLIELGLEDCTTNHDMSKRDELENSAAAASVAKRAKTMSTNPLQHANSSGQRIPTDRCEPPTRLSGVASTRLSGHTATDQDLLSGGAGNGRGNSTSYHQQGCVSK